MCQSVVETRQPSLVLLRTTQNRIVRQTNREAACLLSVEALARQITELSSGKPSEEKLELIQQYAEAMLYTLEDARERLAKLAAEVNDIS
ncbi:hypothetical protein [Vibrio fluvialis]|uniref:hypothetical protein n=1 Tax=Vibrio fluvialis TaxID=676 RepID=UPI00399A4D24